MITEDRSFGTFKNFKVKLGQLYYNSFYITQKFLICFILKLTVFAKKIFPKVWVSFGNQTIKNNALYFDLSFIVSNMYNPDCPSFNKKKQFLLSLKIGFST
jgi:hypothetical protein